MLCKIADLITIVPDAGGLAPRCGAYLYEGTESPDIVIREEAYRRDRYAPHFRPEDIAYMESCRQFYGELVDFDGFYLHSSAAVVDGKAYLFSGFSGVGKSTHVRLWKQMLRDKMTIINDDKPALRRIEGKWIAYGTPWCGKDGINSNDKAVLEGICFLRQGQKNEIIRLTKREAMTRILAQTIRKFADPQKLDKLLCLLELLLDEVPVYELENRPEEAAARLSYETMRPGAAKAEL